MFRRVTPILIGALIAAMCGCSTVSPVLPYSKDGQSLPSTAGPGLVAMRNSPIPDVPMPIGFVALPSESYAMVEGVVRRVKHVYQGRAEVKTVAEFYQSNCRLKRWKSLDKRISNSIARLTFEKGAEKLWINIDKNWSVVTVTITIDDRRLDTAGPPPTSVAPAK